MQLPAQRNERGLDLWKKEIIALKEKLEDFYGIQITEEDIKKAISLGIAKINIHTELCQAAMEAVNAHKDEPFLAMQREVRKAIKERAMYKIKLFGDDGRADE